MRAPHWPATGACGNAHRAVRRHLDLGSSRGDSPARAITRRWKGCMTFAIAEQIIRNIY